MFKGFQNTSRSNGFNGFPALNFQMNNQAYGFSGCTFWLDAAYGLNTQTNLAAVSSWQSRIGNITFSQATAGNQPRFVSSDASFNNYPTVEFYSDTRRLYTDNLFGLNLNQTIAWIAKVDTETTLNNVAGIRDEPPIGVGNQGILQSGNNAVGPQSPGTMVANSNFYGVSGTQRTTTTLIVVITSSNIFVNGINKTTTGTANWGFSIGCIGGSRPVSAGGVGLIGRIAEFIIYSNKFSQDQCNDLSSKLNSKYAIY